MSSKLFVVFGATGQQGGSIIRSVAKDPKLSKEYSIRAVTRDTSSPAAQELQKLGCEVVAGDLGDIESVKKTLQGVHTVFVFTNSRYDVEGQQDEVNEGKAIADAAVAAGAQFIILSSMTYSLKVGQKVDLFDNKGRIEEYIRSLPVKSVHIWPASFMENYRTNSKPRPSEEPGVYRMASVIPPNTRIPLIDTAEDTGKFVAPALADPDKFAGKVIYVASAFYSMEEIAQAIGKATGKTIVYKQVPDDVFRGFMPPGRSELVTDMFTFMRDFGYYGPGGEEKVKESQSFVKEKITTLEEFLASKPVTLD